MNALLSNKTFIILVTAAVAVMTARALTSRGGCPACLLLPENMNTPSSPKPDTQASPHP